MEDSGSVRRHVIGAALWLSADAPHRVDVADSLPAACLWSDTTKVMEVPTVRARPSKPQGPTATIGNVVAEDSTHSRSGTLPQASAGIGGGVEVQARHRSRRHPAADATVG
jgi:hypothetical protein